MMGLILKLLGGTAGPYIAGAVGAIVLVSAGTATIQTMRLDHAKGDLIREQDLFKQEHQAFLTEKDYADKVQKARDSDHQAAIKDVNQVQTACDARVAAARRSASAIQALLNKAPAHASPPPGTIVPDPELIPGDQLWNAIGGQAGSKPASP